MRIIGDAIGPVIAGLFMAIYTTDIHSPEGVTSVPNAMAFNAVFLAGAMVSLNVVAMMIVTKRRELKMEMPLTK